MDRAERGSHGQAAGDDTERVRKTVSSRIRDTIGRIRRQQPELADHLEATVSTGIWCCYQPPPGRVQRPPDSNQRLSVLDDPTVTGRFEGFGAVTRRLGTYSECVPSHGNLPLA